MAELYFATRCRLSPQPSRVMHVGASSNKCGLRPAMNILTSARDNSRGTPQMIIDLLAMRTALQRLFVRGSLHGLLLVAGCWLLTAGC